MKSPVIYNLFPPLVGHIGLWSEHTIRAKKMGFNWIYINPIHYPGFSGSLYAVKDFYRLNPLFIPPGVQDPMLELKRVIEGIHNQGLKIMMDLVINHTAKDSPLINEHPKWFHWGPKGSLQSPSAIDPADSRKITVWGDLAEIDNANSSEKRELWAYWKNLVKYYLDLGVDGFRCDAAYKVPSELWEKLIQAAKKSNREVLFAAETLGCKLPEVRELKGVGFNYLFNSSKWWNFDALWCLEQHNEFQEIAPSISFPESHDTPRMMHESGGLPQIQKLRYTIAAVFSSGIMMPIGYEFGFKRRLHVVKSVPEDWEVPSCDLTSFISRVNQLVERIPVLNQEGNWELLTSLNAPTLALSKRCEGVDYPVIFVINKDWHHEQGFSIPHIKHHLSSGAISQMLRIYHEIYRFPLPQGEHLVLDPGEVVIFIPEHIKIDE